MMYRGSSDTEEILVPAVIMLASTIVAMESDCGGIVVPQKPFVSPLPQIGSAVFWNGPLVSLNGLNAELSVVS